MSQRCLEFDSEVACDEKLTILPQHVRSSESSGTGRPVTNSVVRSRIPNGIGLHLNSLGGFTARGNIKTTINTPCESGSKALTASPTCSAGSELLLSVIDNPTEPDYQEPDSAQRLESNRLQSSVEGISCVNRKASHPDQDAEDGVKPKKRRRSGTPDANCKHCSCKKSKCLKLYCECFASGSYCLDSCGCRNCSNKPEYQDIVSETRQQIQSRNPLAFIPRVVSSAISAFPIPQPEAATGISKHKRGCNCKKSLCLKKYCECYQSEVGCSASCKCIGCKNTFGAKQGIAEIAEETTRQVPKEFASGDEAPVGTPLSTSLLRGAISTIATEEPVGSLSARDFESPVQQTASTCSKSSSNFHAFGTPLHGDNQVSPEFSVSRTGTPEPACQRQLRPRTMVTRSSAASQGYTSVITFSSTTRTLRPGIHSLQSKAVDAGSTAVSQEEDAFPDFLLDPSEVQSGTVTNSPKKKRITPPQVAGGSPAKTKLPPVFKNGRKLTLHALPSLPPVASIRESLKPSANRCGGS